MEETCWKCKGTGVIERYRHIENGRCFACGGDGVLQFSDRKRLSKEYADKGIKSGKLSHLLKVTPAHLSVEKREAWGAALRKAGSEKLGVEIKESYNLAILKNKLLREDNRDKSGMKNFDPKDGKIFNGMVYAGFENGVLQQDSPNEDAEIYTDGNYYENKAGHRIMYPLTPKESKTAEINTAKVLGDPKLDFMRERLREYTDKVRAEKSDAFADELYKQLENVLKMTEKRFGGLIANTMFADGGFEMPRAVSGAVGLFTLNTDGVGGYEQTYKIFIKGDEIKNAMERDTNLEDYRTRLSNTMWNVTRTLVHELGHAYHHTALLKRNVLLYAEPEVSSETPLGNLIVDMYEDKIYELEQMGLPRPKVEDFFWHYDGTDIENAKKIISQFMGFYGATDFREFFANNIEKLGSPGNYQKLKERYPEDYDLLVKTLKGVVDVEALY